MIVMKAKGGNVKYDATGENLWQFRHVHKGPILLLDLDGTIRDDDHRKHLLPSPLTLEMFPENPNRAYNKYQSQAYLDSPIKSIVNIVKMLQTNKRMKTIVLSTGTASESLKSCEVASDQLDSWGVDYDIIMMRSESDQRHSVEQKLDCLSLFRFTDYDLENRVFAFDDATPVVDAFREYGLTTLQVRGYNR